MPWPALLAAGIGAGLGYLGQRSTNAANAREAARNREFQERMSSTSHQREVADLKAAGINPMFRGMGGASTPAGDRAQLEDAVGKGVSTGMQTRLMMAQLQKTKAETQYIEDQALKTRAEVGRYAEESNAGRFDRLVAERDSAVQRAELERLSVEERRALVPLARERALAEIESMMSSAAAARARAALDRAAEMGAINQEEFERLIGEAGPGLKFFMNLLRSVRR